MDQAKLDPSEADILSKILDRVTTHAPPSGVDFVSLYRSWPDAAGRQYMDALYRPKPIETLLSDDLIVRRQWFLVSLPHVVTGEDVAGIIERAGPKGLLDGFEVRQEEGYWGLSRKQPTRLGRFAAEWLAPQLAEAPVACTVDLLVARAAIQEARHGVGIWPPAFIQPEQRPALEVELALLAAQTKAFDRVQSKSGPMVFRSTALIKSFQAVHSKAQDKRDADNVAALEKKVAKLTDEIRRLEALNVNRDEAELLGRFKRLYREHVLNYHPDKLSGRSDTDRRVGEEVTRVLNALYQDIKV